VVTTSAPASTYVLVAGMLATLWSFGIVVIFTPPWFYYFIPVVLAIPELVILAHRYTVRRQMRRELQAAIEEVG
jgi:hypothetical protein